MFQHYQIKLLFKLEIVFKKKICNVYAPLYQVLRTLVEYRLSKLLGY